MIIWFSVLDSSESSSCFSSTSVDRTRCSSSITLSPCRSCSLCSRISCSAPERVSPRSLTRWYIILRFSTSTTVNSLLPLAFFLGLRISNFFSQKRMSEGLTSNISHTSPMEYNILCDFLFSGVVILIKLCRMMLQI